ncbi:hypothetical protein R50072_01330 [Simiduia litorea]|uniref:PDZ domain-containing protein n=1 Tax=Simiduia litorea TaxID=1435348 RepID=UPI0036F1D42A
MRVVALFLAIVSSYTIAAEHGEKGFKMDVNVSGFFSPEVTKATIISVVKNSSAEKSGIVVGDDVIAIDGCEIPGCSASKAKKSLQKNAGEIVVLTMKNPEGKTYLASVTLQ